jgi:hypothetical protein
MAMNIEDETPILQNGMSCSVLTKQGNMGGAPWRPYRVMAQSLVNAKKLTLVE